MQLAGCGTALVTPFRPDGAIDEQALFSLVQWQIASGIDWLVACGTTAETPTLTDDEWQRVVRVIVEAAEGRVQVWVGCTHNSTREAVERARTAAAIAGVHAILTANPYYNKPNQEGQYQHFRAVAEAVELPVILYNIPSRSGANLDPATVARLAADCPNISGIKESSGNLAQITELVTRVSREFSIYAGDDMVALAALGVGGAGLISVAANQIPAEMAQMVHAALANDWSTARRFNRHWFPLMQANFWEPSPGPVKAVLAMQGRIHETYRLPMVPVTQSTRDRLRALAVELGLELNPRAEQSLQVPAPSRA
jgi:4-hydroxy-tetrahydrodipicolinate synthase